jgi:fatty-acyl-CoA synthase
MEAAVVAAPDPKWGEVPVAFVTLKAGAAAAESELIAHARARMAHYKAPKRVEFGELPKNATGKIQKFVLRERARSLAGSGRQAPEAKPPEIDGKSKMDT